MIVISGQETNIGLDYDTLYLYRDKTSVGRPKEQIWLGRCLGIELETEPRILKGEQLWSWRMDLGEEIVMMGTRTERERNDIVDGLRQCLQELNEILKGKAEAGNIQIEKLKDLVDREDQFVKYLEELENKVKNEQRKDGLEGLREIVSKLREEWVWIVTECDKTSPMPRKDIAIKVIQHFHDNICQILKQFWNGNYMKMNLLDFARIVWEYKESVKEFIVDQRLDIGCALIVECFFARLMENTEGIMRNIVENERKEDPKSRELDGLLVTSAALDLFKLVNENFQFCIARMNTNFMAIKLAFFSRRLVIFYQDLWLELLQIEEIDSMHLISLCNNAVIFQRLTKEFADNLENTAQLDERDIEKYFNRQELLRQFIQLGDEANLKLLNFLFKNVECFFKCFFLELNLQLILKEIIDKFQPVFAKLHNVFYKKIWVSFLDKLLMLYLQSFIISCGKVKKNQKGQFYKKLISDRQFLLLEFSSFIPQAKLQALTTPLQQFSHLLETRMYFCNVNCITILRKQLGSGFSLQMIRYIYANLKFDLEAGIKKSILNAVTEELKKIELLENNHNDDNNNNEEDGRQLVGELFMELMQESRVKQEIQQSMNSNIEESKRSEQKQKSLVLQAIQEESQYMNELSTLQRQSTIMESPQEQVINLQTYVSQKVFANQGYLLKKPPNKFSIKSWYKRYFRLRNNILYQFKTQFSAVAQKKLNLSEFTDCFKSSKMLTKFKIEIFGKTYSFKAENENERNSWVDAILKGMKERNSDDPTDSPKDMNNMNGVKTRVEIVLKQGEELFTDFWKKNRQHQLLVTINQQKKLKQIQQEKAKQDEFSPQFSKRLNK